MRKGSVGKKRRTLVLMEERGWQCGGRGVSRGMALLAQAVGTCQRLARARCAYDGGESSGAALGARWRRARGWAMRARTSRGKRGRREDIVRERQWPEARANAKMPSAVIDEEKKEGPTVA